MSMEGKMDLSDFDSHCVDANSVKDLVLKILFKNGDISEENFKEYGEKFGIIIIKKRWFQQIFKKDLDQQFYGFVRIID